MEEVIKFLEIIRKNNNREWFNANKDMYLNAKNIFETSAQKILEGVQEFDSSCRQLTLKDCVYRFYRDLRFTKDMSPYKNHFGLYICPKGKKSMWGGYYFHVEPQNADYLGTPMLACGSYKPDNSLLKSVRIDIVSRGETYLKAIKKAKTFFLCQEPALKNIPKGFPSTKYDDLVKLKTFLLEKDIDYKYLYSKNLVEKVITDFKNTKDFITLLNEAFYYSGNY